ncbi:MAG: metallophosphoesterase family protein, partial [Miltoncostaeaceae bacterium]
MPDPLPRGRPARIALIADTHLPRRGAELPAACRVVAAGCDLIIHAGDHSTLASLDALRALGPPVVAVHGNIEEPTLTAALTATAEVEAGGVRIGVIHDAGPQRGRGAPVGRRVPPAAVGGVGHTHKPADQVP